MGRRSTLLKICYVNYLFFYPISLRSKNVVVRNKNKFDLEKDHCSLYFHLFECFSLIKRFHL